MIEYSHTIGAPIVLLGLFIHLYLAMHADRKGDSSLFTAGFFITAAAAVTAFMTALLSAMGSEPTNVCSKSIVYSLFNVAVLGHLGLHFLFSKKEK